MNLSNLGKADMASTALPRGHAASTMASWYSISFPDVIFCNGSRPANKWIQLLHENINNHFITSTLS